MGTIAFFFWFFISLAIGFFASTQNRNPFGYFLGAMVFSPLLTFVLLLILGDRKR